MRPTLAAPAGRASLDRVRALFSMEAALRRGSALRETGMDRAAFRADARLARSGSAEGAYRLGRSYLEGAGVPASDMAAVGWLDLAAERGHVEAQLQLARLHLLGRAPKRSRDAAIGWGIGASTARLFGAGLPEPDAVEAARLARAAAEAGSSEAQALLAALLAEGPDTIRDPAEAERWAARAAAGGSPHGSIQYALALMRRDGEAVDRPAVVALLRVAAEAGLPAAMTMLGAAMDAGWAGPAQPALSASYHRRAAEAGYPIAQTRWGRALIEGRGTPRDECAGETWLRRAAFAGEVDAQVLLGDRCAAAGAAPPSFTEAALWYRRAADAGHRGAARALGQLCLTGAGVEPDRDEAARWFHAAAGGGDAAARAELGNLLLAGAGDGDDRASTCRAFAAAADGDPVSAFNYGVCLAEGLGTPRDDTRAAVWLRRAAESVVDARFWYGRFLLEGRGVVRDPAAGRAWITAAAEAGHAAARAALAVRPVAGGPRAAARFGAVLRAAVDRPKAPSEPAGAMGARDDKRAAAALRAAVAEAGRGDQATAEAHCLAALDAVPVSTDALWRLHRVRAGGDGDAAIALLRRLLAIDANHVPATLELATLLFERDDLAEAERLARNAVRLAPTHERSHHLLGMVLTELQQGPVGEFHYRRALALTGTRDPILLANLAWNLKTQGRIEEGRRLYAESAAASQVVFQTWLGWGQLEEADGALDAAGHKFDRAAALRPDAPELRIARGKLLMREGRFEAALAALDQPPDPGGAPADPSAMVERGRLLDRVGRHAEAFAHFDEGKRLARALTGRRYLAREAGDLAERLKGFFAADRLRLMPENPVRPDVAQPIFILGFPRSGTTMVEQALSNHPQIAAGDELPFIGEMAGDLPRLLGSPLTYPEALSELWMGDKAGGLAVLRDAYLHKAAMRGLATGPKPWFTDKMPLNEMHLGLIALVFPRSPLVHVIRHPLDVVLSVYSHHLTHGYFCAYDLDSIALHYRLIADLVAHYRAAMPLRYLPIRYEDLVDNMETGVRRMLGFIGEEFDPNCTDFQANRRRPQTPSYAQVIETIHDRSRYRYRKFLPQLEAATVILQPVIERLGYSID